MIFSAPRIKFNVLHCIAASGNEKEIEKENKSGSDNTLNSKFYYGFKIHNVTSLSRHIHHMHVLLTHRSMKNNPTVMLVYFVTWAIITARCTCNELNHASILYDPNHTCSNNFGPEKISNSSVTN